MKNLIYVISVLFLVSCNKMTKKEYKAQIGSACAKTSTGGFMIYDSCRLYFKKDSVKINIYQTTTNDPIVRRKNLWGNYSYNFIKDTISIKGFDYEKLLYKNDTLIYFYKLDNGNTETLKFIKQ